MQSFRSDYELLPESCTKYRSEAHKAFCLKRSWSDFDPQVYTLYGEDQNHGTSFKGNALQTVRDSWCKIQVLYRHPRFIRRPPLADPKKEIC